MRQRVLRPVGPVPAMKRLFVLLVACSSPNPTSSSSSSASSSESATGWKLDVATCERNQIFTKDDHGPQSMTVVGKDGDDCVVHVKHSVGYDWTESDCKVPRSAGTITVVATDKLPGSCTLVESGTEMH